MATKFALASPANFAGNSLMTEFPIIANLGWAAFVGDGSLNAQDNVNLAGTGALANVGSGPVLNPNFGRFTAGTNGWQTPTPDAVSFTLLQVVRFNASFAMEAGVTDGSFTTAVEWTAAGQQTAGQPGTLGATLAGLFAGQWICMAFTKGPNGALGALTNLSAGTTAPSTAVSTGTKANANWQVGSIQASGIGGFTFASDIAFTLGVPSVVPLATLQQAYASLKGILAPRGIVVV